MDEVKRIMEAMSRHVAEKGGFPSMSVDYDSLWCSDGQAACMVEFLVHQLAELRLRVKALEGKC